MEYHSGASFLGKPLVFPANVRLDWKVIASYKHSSLFGLIVSDEGKKCKYFNQLENMGILFVYTDDETYAAKLKITVFPTIAYFRNGERLMYEGSIENEMAVLRDQCYKTFFVRKLQMLEYLLLVNCSILF